MRLTVACVLWVGEFENRKYSPEWVLRLRRQVASWLPEPHRFVCLSNVDVHDVETMPLRTNWPGWWAKLELFDPRNDLGERVLYLDLDVFVTGDLTPLGHYPASMALMPPSHVFGGLRPRELPGVVRKYQASCISFAPPAGRALFEECTADTMTTFRSDQDWIGHRLPDCATMPALWFAKSKQCQKGVPRDVRLVLAHRVDLVGRSLREVVSC